MSIDGEIDGTRLEVAPEYKYLGVLLDQHLNFTSHTFYIKAKVAQRLNLLKK